MIVAAVVTIIFHRFKQPVVLGYILAGVIIGPQNVKVQHVANAFCVPTKS